MRARAALVLVLLALPALPGAAVPVSGALGARGGVEIRPARIERDLREGSVSLRLVVVNHDAAPRRVHLGVTGLAHDLAGATQLLDPSPVASAVRLGESDFTLEAGERREVTVEATIPAGRPSLYAAVAAGFAPLQAAPGEAGRAVTPLLLRGPRPWREKAILAGVGLLPSRKGEPLRVYADLTATGDVHVNPVARMRVLLEGDEIDSVRLTGGAVLPGLTRRFTGSWIPGEVPGPGLVTLEAAFINPPAVGRAGIDLNRAGLREPAAEIRGLQASAGAAGAVVTLALENTGPVAVSPVVTLTVTEGEAERARSVLPQAPIAPGESRAVRWAPALGRGVFQVRVRAEVEGRLLDQTVGALGLGRRAAPKAPGPAVPVAAVAGGAALLAAVALVVGMRRHARSAAPPIRPGAS